MGKKTKKWFIALGVLSLFFVLYGIWRVQVPAVDAGEITAVSFTFNPVGVTSRKNCTVWDQESVRRLCDYVNQMEKNGFAFNRTLKGGGWASVFLNFYKGDVVRWTVSISGGEIVEYQGAFLPKTFHLGEGEAEELQQILTELWEENPDSSGISYTAMRLRKRLAEFGGGGGSP